METGEEALLISSGQPNYIEALKFGLGDDDGGRDRDRRSGIAKRVPSSPFPSSSSHPASVLMGS